MAKESKILVLFFLFMIIGCHYNKDTHNNIVDDNNIMSIFESYIENHSNYNTFLIQDSWDESFSEIETPSGFFLGPCYQELLKSNVGFPSFDIKNSRVYVDSKKFDFITIQRMNDEWVNNNPRDSFINRTITDKTYIKDKWANYIHRAIYVYEKNGSIYVNHRPDTIFVPICVKSDVMFTY